MKTHGRRKANGKATNGTRGRGRPLTGDVARSVHVMIRLTPGEMIAFETLAAREQRKVADWVRVQALNVARKAGA